MKTIVFTNHKGGVGKSALVTQFAYFLAADPKMIASEAGAKRVLVVDLDHQRNASKALKTGGLAAVIDGTANDVLSGKTVSVPRAEIVLLAGDSDLMTLEREKAGHNDVVNNLDRFLRSVQDQFDVCIIDTNPNPDIRQLGALVVSDYAVSPIQLNQEAIDGIGDLLNHPRIGIRRIETAYDRLKFLGILPNLLEPTPFQRDNFRALAAAYGKLLIASGEGFAAIKKSTAVAEAQAAGLPVWRLGKTSGRDAWREMRPVFETIAKLMEI